MNTFDIVNNAPEGATHYRPKDDEWDEYYIKVVGQGEEHKVFMWIEMQPEWGHWSDIPAYDKDPDNYIKIGELINVY